MYICKCTHVYTLLMWMNMIGWFLADYWDYVMVD